jgi:hypothetical protein
MGLRKALEAAALCGALAVVAGATVSANGGTPKGGLDRVMADIYVQVRR